MDEKVLMDEVLEALGNGFELESVGSVDELGYYALVETSLGVVVYIENDLGFKHILRLPDRASAQAEFLKIVEEYDAYYMSCDESYDG